MSRGLLLVLLAAALPPAVFANSTGPPIFSSGVPNASDNNGSTCTRCHTTFPLNSPGGSMRVETFHYRPGQRQTVRVTVAHPESSRWGFQLTARLASDVSRRAGTFVLDPSLRVRCSDPASPGRDVTAASPCQDDALEFVSHTQPLTITGANGTRTFEVEWTPPATDQGDVIFFASGNAANANGNNQGDRIYNNGPEGFRIEAQGGSCSNSTRPSLRGVGNAAALGTQIAPNTLVSFYGQDFVTAGVSRIAGTADFGTGRYPTELACVAVEVNGQRIPIYSVQPSQINAVLPLTTGTGPATFRVIVNPGRGNQMISDPGTSTVTNTAPGLFAFQDGRSVAAVLLDGTYVANPALVPGGRPVRTGDVIQVFATGLGRTDPDWQAGEFPNRPSALRERLTVTINGTALAPADVLYAGVVPLSISGFFQINLRVPAGLPNGNVPISVTAGGLTTAAGATLPVQNTP